MSPSKTLLDSQEKRAIASGGDRESGGWGLAAILALCTVIMTLRWTKMDSLYNIDPSMWLSQVGRFASGQIPYRDFSWNYPPLAIFLLGWCARWFGATFAVIQTAMDVISLANVLLCWWLVRYLLPASTRFVTVAAVVAIGSTSLTKFNLFSFSTYSPSLEIASAGLLMLMIGGVRQLRGRSYRALDFSLVSCGAFIASVSKPEALVAAWVALVLLFALDRSRNWRWYAALCATTGIFSAAVYLLVASQVGFPQLLAGIGGYGLASFACPWWPTGLGAFGAIATIGEAVFAVAALIWPVRSILKPAWQPRTRWIWIGGFSGLLFFASYVWYQAGDILLSPASRGLKLEALGRSVIWTSPALLPAMWASICVWVCLILCWRRLSGPARVLCFVLSVPVVMSARSLFGTTLFPYTEVSAMCYPCFVIAAACLIDALYDTSLVRRTAAATIAISALLGGYSALRLVAAYPSQLSNRNYYALKTNAGTVRLSDDHVSEQIYTYILRHANPSDTLLDLPYGGGFNFATGLRSPVFTTQFQQLRMPLTYQLLDLENVETNPPRLVIADSGRHFLTQFGYAANMNCVFPRLAWQPDRPSWDPSYVFPVVRYLEQTYGLQTKIGPKIILAPANLR